jgi:hypothetical protein
MALTRLDNLYSSKTGKYLYVSPDDFNATDELDNRGNSPLRPFKTIQRAFIEVSRYSYLPGRNNDRFDQFTIMLMPGNHYIDNRPGLVTAANQEQRYLDAANLVELNRNEITDRALAEVAVQHPDFYYPGDAQTGSYSRFKDSYRLIQLNRAEIVSTAYAQIAIDHPTFINPDPAKCQRDIGYFVDAVSLDIAQGGGNVYARKFVLQYFDSTGSPITNGLVGEIAESNTAFNKARDLMIQAITNQLTVTDTSITPDPATGSNTDPASCANVSSAITTLTQIVTDVLTAGSISSIPAETVSTNIPTGEQVCRRDVGYIIDAVVADLRTGGNSNVISATKAYFDRDGNPISDGLIGEEAESITAFNKARDMMQLAVTNSLYGKDLTLSIGPAVAGASTPDITYNESGNTATCVDVQSTIATLIAILTDTITAGNLSNLASVQVTGNIPVFNYNQALQEWQDNSILDLSNPDNVLYKFNAATGGAIVPRGCSLIGYDLRRTVIRPLYVPDPADGGQERTSIFNLTGGCYLWQFTIKDGDLSANSPLYDTTAGVGKVYFQKGNTTNLAIPEFSHHKICIMEYADQDDLKVYYEKVGRAFAQFQPSIDDGEFEALVQENRIVGPLSDTRRIESIKVQDTIAFTGIAVTTNTVLTNVSSTAGLELGATVTTTSPSITIPPNTTIVSIVGDTVTLSNPVNGSGSASFSSSTGKITATVTTKIDHGYFEEQYVAILNSGLNDQVNGTFKVTAIDEENPKVFQYEIQSTTAALGLIDGTTYNTSNGLNTNAVAQAEIDSVESASPYVFNCSIRSTWGQCGMWADGSKATGFKSMVVAQYTGVSLQKDDRAFIRYDKFTNTWNQASLSDAFATVPYHTKGDAYWKDDWRNFHIRASDDSFIQCVSVFAVGFFDHFLMESGGDMSITNSNSNFGNTSLHAVGFKGFSFNQDKGGYISDIIPPKVITESIETKTQWYTLDVQASNDAANNTRLYVGSDDAVDPTQRPAATIEGFRIGARSDEKLYVKLDNGTYYSTIEPNGFLRYTASLETLNPAGLVIDNLAQDASNLINLNKAFIQNEAYNYIITKYPYLLSRTDITISTCERDIGYFVDAVVADLRLGGNINSIQAAEAYFSGGSLIYIENELDESIETYDYVKNLCISAMRNWDFLVRNCTVTNGSSIVDVGSTVGLLVGMSVKEYAAGDFNADGQLSSTPTQITTAITANTYIKRILDDSRIELGVSGSYLTNGATVNAVGNRSASAYLYFELADGAFSSTLNPEKDLTVSTLNAGYPECANVATTIQGYFDDIFIILNQGLTPVGGREIDAHNLILENKELIAEVAVDRMLTNFPGFSVPGGNQECIDDIIAVIRTIAFNVKYGGNNQVYDAAEIYVTNPSYLAGEQDQAVYAYQQARDMMIQAMRNDAITITGSTRTQFIDPTVIADPASPACADVATTITNLSAIITQGIGTSSTPGNLIGITKSTPTITSVTRVEPVSDIAGLSKRATLFTINTGGSLSNPHQFETGTPVRLVPKARSGTNPDKRVIRLPNGFDTNTKYYVIAPGRVTKPENYSTTTYFDGSDQTKLMLAATKENAAAGIYIYSPETDTVDPDVEIELQQYVLDDVYDLHKYKCNLAGAGELETDVSHIFDLPSASVTPQKVFFRVAADIVGSDLPELAGLGTIDTQTYYYARYISSKKFSVHTTHADAIAGVNAISFVPSSGRDFYVFADKRRSPLRFDAQFSTSSNNTGLWYVQVKDESTAGPDFRSNSILTRFHDPIAYGPGSGKIRTLDTWITRVTDNRSEGDRVYRLKYVIPSYLQTVRDPLNGFVMKIRTDDKRRLIPQKFVLRPVSGSPDVARFDNPEQPGEVIGLTRTELAGLGIPNPTYDPYFSAKIVTSDRTQSRIAFSIQSARKVAISGTDYLEITAFDHTITVDALRNEIFTIVEINAPQGGAYVVSNSTATSNNAVTWSGNSSGTAYIQGYFTVNSRHYLVLKNVTGSIVYNNIIGTRFTQGAVFADLVAKPNSVGDPSGRDKSNRRDFLYRIEGANVYTLVPGDIITDDASNQYIVEDVQDVGAIEDTFYIFDIDTIQQRIPGQQDGIYYLTCLRGNISPFPQGAGVGSNFQNFKFSQPISQLYPINYKNDPVWFKQINPNYNDVPATRSAADNYIHGLVTINDAKNSETKELVEDLVVQPALNRYQFVNSDILTSPTLNPVGGSNIIQAQNGNATSGSEDRYIPICGDSDFPTEGKLYVELRRPSIARSGNHTFEYLGFGPGNYSTGFPLRQEVVLEDIQDFYAQSKRENGGIVFYTGLNSNGDLYIGNRKVNAITGEETFLERAVLEDSADDSGDSLGGLVTTFDTPVTFNDRITVEGDAVFNNPVSIVMDVGEGPALTIPSVIDPSAGIDDPSISTANTGSIVLHKNRIDAAIYGINPRQVLGDDGQPYTLRTHYTSVLGPTNITPDQSITFSPNQNVSFGPSQTPRSGDIILKGDEVGLSGSLGWIYANYYTDIAGANIATLDSDGTYVTFTLSPGVTNNNINITSNSIVRISGFTSNPNINGNWQIVSTGFSPTGTSFRILPTVPPAAGTTYTWATVVGAQIEVSREKWKEIGVIGAETLRTNTETWGDYKLGINTLARATDTGYQTAFIESATAPRANLDIVGTTFISGKTTAITVAAGVQTKVESNSDNAFLVGGDSASPDSLAAFRVATTPGPGGRGRIGINTTVAQMASVGTDHVIVGTTNIIGNVTINGSLQIFIGSLDTTSTTVDLMATPTTVRIGASATTIELGNGVTTTSAQSIAIGNYASEQNITIGDAATTTTFYLHRNSTNAIVDIASVANNNIAHICDITIGGAFANAASITRIKTKNINLDGDVQIGSGYIPGSSVGKLFALTSEFELLAASGGPSVVRFATTASSLDIGSQGGTTTINNALRVRARADFDGDILLSGGLNSGGFVIERGIFGTAAAPQLQGGLPSNFNIDLYRKNIIGKTLDTVGFATLDAVSTVINLNQIVSPGEISIGDYLLLDESAAFAGSPVGYVPDEDRSEIVRVVALTNLTNTADPLGIRVEVERGVDGTTAQTHPDNLPIFRLTKSANVSYSTQDINAVDTQIETAEFGGSINPGDYLRVNAVEFVKIVSTIAALTSVQSLRINDGGAPAVTAFEVESTTGNTYIRGTTEVHDTLTLVGSTSPGSQKLVVTDGASAPVTVFDIDSANGNTRILGNVSVGTGFNRLTIDGSNGNTVLNGGDITINDSTAALQRLQFINNTGNLTISGLYASTGTGTNDLAGNLAVRGGDLTVSSAGTTRFKVNPSGTIDLGGIDYYFGPSGARRWDYMSTASGDGGIIESNVNYWINASGTLVLRLPISPRNGDMIRFVEISSTLSYNLKLIIRAATGVNVQGDGSNVANTIIIPADLINHNGGELIVTTPNAAFGLIYAGPLNSDGSASGVPTAMQGWWLTEI